MDSTTSIYTRTLRGNAELNARKPTLDALSNSLLLLVDGKRTHREMLGVALRLGAPVDCLDRLQAGGFVESQDPPNAVPLPEAEFVESQFSHAELHGLLYRHMIDAAKTHLGLKGFLFHIKVEKAVSFRDLEKLIAPLGDAIAKARGLDTGNDFVRRMKAICQP